METLASSWSTITAQTKSRPREKGFKDNEILRSVYGFWYAKENRPTHLQVKQPVLTLGLLFLGRLTLACLVGSLSDSLEGHTSFPRRLIGTFWPNLCCIADAVSYAVGIERYEKGLSRGGLYTRDPITKG